MLGAGCWTLDAGQLESRGSGGGVWGCPSVRLLRVDGQVSPAVACETADGSAARIASSSACNLEGLEGGGVEDGRGWRGEEKGCSRHGSLAQRKCLCLCLWLPGRGRLAKGPVTSPFFCLQANAPFTGLAAGLRQSPHRPPSRLRNNRSLAVHPICRAPCACTGENSAACSLARHHPRQAATRAQRPLMTLRRAEHRCTGCVVRHKIAAPSCTPRSAIQ